MSMCLEQRETLWAILAAGALHVAGGRSDRAAATADSLMGELEKRSAKWRAAENATNRIPKPGAKDGST